jgi:cardiolipin synthase
MRLRSVATLPNLITLVRLAFLPWYVRLLGQGHFVPGGFVLGFLGATDWVDGWVARRFNQVSEFGKVLDPVADRTVFFVGVGAAMYYSVFPAWFGAAILIREVSIAAMMVGATLFGMERFSVTIAGKRATFALLCAVPWIIVGHGGGWWTIVLVAGWSAGIPGLVLSYVTLLQYVPLVRAHVASGRRAKGLPLGE